MIEAERITVRAGTRQLLSDVSVAIAPGQVAVVVGPNGAGKSTLMRTMTGEIRPAAGQVRLDGQPLERIGAGRLAERRAVLPQASSLAFPFTVHEVVRLGVSRLRDPAAVRGRVAEALSRVDLGDFGPRFFQELSGGEQQRVHLARVLCQVWKPVEDGVPNYLFLDEPTASLDLRHQILILDEARRFARAGGGVVAILHDLNLAALYGDHLVVIANGHVASEGPPQKVLTDAMIRSVFGIAIRVGSAPAGRPFILPHAVEPA
ncbi:heme ABC transporter ATP-binding protein [Kaistia algarum]|uniref:heme ABC transporter ATP-binding protein n=1 Tax=Kaistia algarum TaxID=2083279 RepID=UPI000CE8D2CE|nr:heme ABC transporter ATP-binding protein [Kaistia algarum]MCX5513493.1 heme ABC transporter ATP-binding protein [Kaistia algarum]PPE78123.1 heme ABC transporter ATP-binding protein [Kaistia algarum]